MNVKLEDEGIADFCDPQTPHSGPFPHLWRKASPTSIGLYCLLDAAIKSHEDATSFPTPTKPAKTMTPPTPTTPGQKPPQFPPHQLPRVWLITSTTSPIGTAIARHALSHGDSVLAGLHDIEVLKRLDFGAEEERGVGQDFREFWREVLGRKEWRGRCRAVGLDGRCEDPWG